MTRRFPGQRALHIVVRTAHLAAIAMLLGSVTFTDDAGRWAVATVLTGGLLVADDLYRYGEDWFRYVQSWAILAKLGLLVMGCVFPALLEATLWSALVIGGLISHAPGHVRQFAIWGEVGPCARSSLAADHPQPPPSPLEQPQPLPPMP